MIHIVYTDPGTFVPGGSCYVCLPLRGRWHGVSRDGGSVPLLVAHSPSHLPVTAPLWEGAKGIGPYEWHKKISEKYFINENNSY